MKIGGVSFILNGIDQDYCFLESIQSMLGCCDEVHILDAGSTDGTREALAQIESDRVYIHLLPDRSLWDSVEGPTKLSFFTNIAIEKAQERGMDYIFLVQMDEVVHEDSYANIRAAAELGHEAYVGNRYNLFKDPYHMLNVPQDRKPCSSEVIRLNRSHCRAYSDSEHVASNDVHMYNNSLESIEIFHMGFVREKKKHLVKIKHMLTQVFKMGMDTRAENCEEFQWDRFFSEKDLRPIPKPLPKVVQQWAKERYPEIEVNY